MASTADGPERVLRVDLSTGSITKEDTLKYKDYLGGSGLGFKVLWDEVPPGTKAWDPANRIIFGVGPLTGTGAPLSGRTTIISLWPNHPDELPGSGHMGGHWGPELKYAGYDAIIIQGKAARPGVALHQGRRRRDQGRRQDVGERHLPRHQRYHGHHGPRRPGGRHRPVRGEPGARRPTS